VADGTVFFNSKLLKKSSQKDCRGGIRSFTEASCTRAVQEIPWPFGARI
jgi:hypothetical protein